VLRVTRCAGVPRLRSRSRGWSRLAICYWLVVAALMFGLLVIWFACGYRGAHLQAADFAYPASANPDVACPGGRGEVADHRRRQTAAGIRFQVTTPANYRPEFPHPLLVVWAPAGVNEALAERFTGLTGPATRQGFVVAHVRSVPLGERALRALAEVPVAILQDWCIDPARIAYTGHSDGGTLSMALAVLTDLDLRPAVIAPSAAGMQAADLETFPCPAPLPVMVMHNLGDGHFPDYGVGAADWWAACNGCGSARVTSGEHPGCESYTGCRADTLLCRAAGNHAHWPGFEHRLPLFLERTLAAPSPPG